MRDLANMTKRFRRIIILPTVGIILAVVAFISIYMMLSAAFFSVNVILIGLAGVAIAVYIFMIIISRLTRPSMEAIERVQIMFNASPLAIFLYDLSFKPIDCNKKALELFGFANEQEAIEHFLKTMPLKQPNDEDSYEYAIKLMKAALEHGVSTGGFVVQKPDGTSIPAEVTYVRVSYNESYVIAEYVRDLSEVRAAEEKELEMRRFNQFLLDSAPFVINVWNSKDELTNTSHQVVKLFGVKDEQEYVDKFYELSPKFQPCGSNSRKKALEYVRQAFRDGYARFEWMHQTKNGEPLPMDVTLVRFQLKDEEVLLTYASDIRPIIAANNKFKMLFDLAPVALEIWDEELNLIDCNEHVKIMFGLNNKREYIERLNELMPEYQPNGVHSMNEALALVRKTFEEGLVTFEWMYLDENGDHLPVSTTFMRYMDQGKPYVVGYNLDLRNIMKAMEKEGEAELATRESKAKTRFLAQISHEIRTPMNAVLGIAEIQLQNEDLTAELKDSLSRIRNASYLLLGIINDLLDLSKAEAGKMEIVNKRYEVVSLVVDTMQINVIYIGSKRIDFVVDVDPNVPFALIGDELRLKQIINNVLSNAAKYTDEGTITFSIGLVPCDPEDLDCEMVLAIRIKDTGRGMEQAQVDQLFTGEYLRFSEDDAIQGTGLGMAITGRLVEMMNGEVEVESEVGKGTQVTLYIPQKSAGSEIIGEEYAQKLQTFTLEQSMGLQATNFIREPMPYGNILVVDDVEVNLFVAKGLLRPYELNIDTALSGFEAIDLVNEGKVYDIIFMDHMMPHMDGVETVRKLRDDGYEGAVVALTANALVGNYDMFVQKGFDGFISKPIDIRELNQVLNKFVSGRHPDKAKEYKGMVQFEAVKASDAPMEATPEMLRVFRRDAEQAIDILQKTATNGDIELFTITVHAMKSALLNIGRSELSKEAAKLENAGMMGDKLYISLNAVPFIEDLEALVQEIQSLSPYSNGGSDSKEGIAYLFERLRVVVAACEKNDVKAAIAELDRLLAQPWSKDVADFLHEAHDVLLLESDFEAAGEMVKEFLER